MDNKDDKTVRVNIRVPKEMYSYYKTKSYNTGVSMSALMYLDLENYLMFKNSSEQLPLLLAKMNELEK